MLPLPCARPCRSAADTKRPFPALLTSSPTHCLSRFTPSRVSRALLALQGRVELLLSLLARTLGRCRCEPELLLPLGRVAMQVMPLDGGGEGLALLQLQSAGGSLTLLLLLGGFELGKHRL